MAHLGPRAFDSIGGEVVSTTSFVISNQACADYKGSYIRLTEGKSETEKRTLLEGTIRTSTDPSSNHFHRTSASSFLKIPGAPIAYWASAQLIAGFEKWRPLDAFIDTAQGMKTLNNERFIREWYEVERRRTTLDDAAIKGGKKWYPVNHGGEFRKWYGNNTSVINWQDEGKEIKELAVQKYNSVTRTVTGMGYYLQPGITWTAISTGKIGVRKFEPGFLFTNAGMCAFGDEHLLSTVCAYLNSNVSESFLAFLSPTINFGPNQIKSIPFSVPENASPGKLLMSDQLIEIARADWNSYEIAWHFARHPLLEGPDNTERLDTRYSDLRASQVNHIRTTQTLEEANNRLFVDACNLHNELSPEVPLHEITLTCNPHYRYGPGKSNQEYETLQRADTMREFISYAVGCMFGRYSLDKPGLILANQGQSVEDYLRIVKPPSFLPDEDNVIPILGGTWFEDDIVERFLRFIKVTFGTEHFDENLAYIEEALGRDIRNYFVREFYTHHVKMYKKRPIYWLFSSPKGSFNVLIYMHRYRPDTVSVILNDYLRAYVDKLTARKRHLEQVSVSGSATSKEKTAALKEIDKLEKTLTELTTYEKEILYPLALQQLEINLDDGVKTNYPKFGKALKKVAGLS